MKKYILFLIINWSVFYVYGQADNAPLMFDNSMLQKTYTVSNPDTYSFEKYNISDINYYVGKANISIPLYTIEAGNIIYPITLNYDTGGIKVDQYASNVGLGWSLSKTVITRTIHQDNDFAGLIRNSKVFKDRLLDNEKRWPLVRTNNAGYFLEQEKQNTIYIDTDWPGIDFLPDVYNVYGNDLKTNFFFKDINTAIESNVQGSIIEATVDVKRFYPFSHESFERKYGKYIFQWPTVDFFSFVIKRNNGLHYYFNDCDISSSFNNHYTSYYAQFIHLPSPQVSSWNISKIIDTSTGNTIDFEYKTIEASPGKSFDMFSDEFMQTARTSYVYSPSLDVPDQLSGECVYNEIGTNDADMWGEFEKKLVKQSNFDVERKRLKKIKFPEGVVEFYYNNEQVADGYYGEQRRLDSWEGDYLTYLVVRDLGGNVIKSFTLNYDYFISDETGKEFQPYTTNSYLKGYRYNRLKLVSVKEDNKPAYEFTYEENIKLPPVNSFSIDFLGYYNNSKDVSNLKELFKKTPTVYFYPNQFEKSVLPFEVPGVFSQKIEGYFDRRANDYAKAWSLKKIKYPEGGELVLNYELNDFTIFGDDKMVKGGGIRVKNQILYDGDNNIAEVVNYEYNNEKGISSGKLFSIPFYGHPLKKFFDIIYADNAVGKINWIPQWDKADITDLKYFKIQDKSNLNEDITSGAFIGYSRVIESKDNVGKKEFHFTSSNKEEFTNKVYRNTGRVQYTTVYPKEKSYQCISQFLIFNSGISSNIFTDFGYKRGKVLQEINYNSSGIKVKEINYDYNSLLENQFVSYWQPINQPAKMFLDNRGIVQLLQVNKNYIIDNYLPTMKETIYFNGNNKIIDQERFSYNDDGTLSEYSKNGEGKYYYYSNDIGKKISIDNELTSEDLNGYVRMKELNNIGTPVQITNYIADESEETTKIRSVFKNINVGPLGGLLPVLNKVQSCIGEDSKFEDDYKVLLYNNIQSSLIQRPIVIQEKSGKKIGLIWGYNNSRIIAKIENIENTASIVSSGNQLVSTAIINSNIPFSSYSESKLLESLMSLRRYLLDKNPNALITTYTFMPLVGVSTITDNKGIISYYKYDNANRLKQVLDSDKNILEEYGYNFKNN
ncbi:MAG: hypothetical protein LBE34_00070 [Flavobacteriaceae bacterium]|jgi:hypothetical protein|nr:hypothetical protein [Flavobacteriaceae bacterium]